MGVGKGRTRLRSPVFLKDFRRVRCACMIAQVLGKGLTLDDIKHDDDMLQAWEAMRYEREPTLIQLQCNVAVIQETTGLPFSTWKCPDVFVLRPSKANEVRLFNTAGESILVDRESGHEALEIANEHLDYDFPMQSRVMDQSSVNLAEVHLLFHWVIS